MQTEGTQSIDRAGEAAGEKVTGWFEKAVGDLGPWLGWVLVLVFVVAFLLFLGWLFFGRKQELTRTQLRVRGVVLIPLFGMGVLLLLVTMPVSDTINNSLIGLFGLCIAALITLGSTTIFANFMAGVMMYHVRSFRAGDYIRIDDHSGRVTAKGLFHVEIQTEDRDLVTLPNAYLITNPVRVVRSSGTIIACEVSLGYDVPHARAQELMHEAIVESGLTDGFVQIRELGDFSVLYRACGLLEDTKKLVSTRTTLRTNVLDALHEGGVEIVSPNFINHRHVPDGVFPERVRTKQDNGNGSPEDVIFDKAEDAERVERVRLALTEAKGQIKALEERLASAEKEEQDGIRADIEHQQKLVQYLTSRVARLEAERKV